MSNITVKLPETITIPRPEKLPTVYGLFATSGPHGTLFPFRTTTFERDKIHRAAELLDIPTNSMIRCVLSDVADMILKLAGEYEEYNRIYNLRNIT